MKKEKRGKTGMVFVKTVRLKGKLKKG